MGGGKGPRGGDAETPAGWWWPHPPPTPATATMDAAKVASTYAPEVAKVEPTAVAAVWPCRPTDVDSVELRRQEVLRRALHATANLHQRVVSCFRVEAHAHQLRYLWVAPAAAATRVHHTPASHPLPAAAAAEEGVA